MDDRALVDAVLSGDRQAFDALVQRDTRSVYQVCLRILGQPQDAEDVTQESFVAAFRALRTFRGEGTLRAWLLRIATRQAFRRLGQRRATVDLADVSEPRLVDPAAEPAREVIDRDERRIVRDAVGALPEPYREVVALRFFADLSLADVAEATGRPLNTVKTHLRRGLERLRPVLGEDINS